MPAKSAGRAFERGEAEEGALHPFMNGYRRRGEQNHPAAMPKREGGPVDVRTGPQQREKEEQEEKAADCRGSQGSFQKRGLSGFPKTTIWPDGEQYPRKPTASKNLSSA
jgi:hypothetical protein